MIQHVAIVICSILVAICYCQSPSKPTVDFNTLLEQVFNMTEKVSCDPDQDCVPRHLCINGEISKDGAGAIRIRFDGCEDLEVCCRRPKKTVPTTVPTTVSPTVPPTAPPTFPPTTPSRTHEGCGYRNTDIISSRISNGAIAEFGEFPWMVAILAEKTNAYIAGGSLIAPNVILTGAAKVYNKTAGSLRIRAGEWDTQSTNEPLPHQDKDDVREIIVHENFVLSNLHNNIALLILDTPFQLAKHINTICLPTSDINFDYSRCYVSGWGKEAFGRKNQFQKILKKLDLPMVPNDQCERDFRQTRLGPYFELDKSFVCAGGEKDRDTCDGDGGSPLVCPIPGVSDRFYQVGVVAWGLECGVDNEPGVYTNIPYLRSWIDENLARRGISLLDVAGFTIRIKTE